MRDTFDEPIPVVSDVLKNTKGIVAAAARHLDINKDTLYEYIKRHNLMPVLIEIRRKKYEDKLDLAEEVINYRLSRYKEEPSLSFQTAKYVLDKRGASRGWTGINDSNITEIELNVVKSNESSIQHQSETIIESGTSYEEN